MKLKFYFQHDQMDCGPACLAMITSYYGKDFGLPFFRDHSYITRDGVSLLGMKEACKNIGLGPHAVKTTFEGIDQDRLPCILHWNQNHFVVLHKISKNILTGTISYKIADPGHGLITLTEDKFRAGWLPDGEKGIILYVEPTDLFYSQKCIKEEDVKIKSLLKYLKPHKKQISILFVLLFLGTLTTLIFPILTQQLIDNGVQKKDISIISYILLAQLSFFIGNIVFGIFRNWITLTVGSKINIRIISDFLKKLLSLPVSFFDTKMLGDFNQRIQDHERIEQFLTSQSLLTLFSIITFSTFFAVLGFYDYRILTIYLVLTLGSIAWSLYWIRKRDILDYFRFQQRSENQQSIYEIINGVSEMKLNQFEDYKRKDWEEKQQKLFNINIRILKLDQLQSSGFEFINQLKNIIVTFLAAIFVVHDKMTLGALLSVSYIIGQMNNPITQLITFFRSWQDASLSLKRLNEVQNHRVEEQRELITFDTKYQSNSSYKEGGIQLKQVSFQYEGPNSPFVLENINVLIPDGKITAIVGASGSGKTTLMKLLLRFYSPTSGKIFLNLHNILSLSPKSIREQCGVVMQDGYIFSDTIERNIAMGDDLIDDQKMANAIKIANLSNFLESLPLGLKTKIGSSGNGISGGQKQRILIARAVYKNPHYILFDEATSALDSANERIIHENLQSFFIGKTVIIIAHRLSTVKNADQIIVLDKGKVIELGTHKDLTFKKGQYFSLVKDQLELGN